MRISRSIWTAGLALIISAGVARAEEPTTPVQMDNPQYQAWASYGVGSSETLEGQVDGGNGQKITMESTQALKQKSDDQVTLEITVTMEMMGQKHTMPPKEQVIKAQIEKEEIEQVGEEEVAAAGKTFACKIYEGHSTNGKSSDSKVKIWFSEEVPGGIVKMEAVTPHGTITSILKSFEIK